MPATVRILFSHVRCTASVVELLHRERDAPLRDALIPNSSIKHGILIGSAGSRTREADSAVAPLSREVGVLAVFDTSLWRGRLLQWRSSFLFLLLLLEGKGGTPMPRYARERCTTLVHNSRNQRQDEKKAKERHRKRNLKEGASAFLLFVVVLAHLLFCVNSLSPFCDVCVILALCDRDEVRRMSGATPLLLSSVHGCTSALHEYTHTQVQSEVEREWERWREEGEVARCSATTTSKTPFTGDAKKKKEEVQTEKKTRKKGEKGRNEKRKTGAAQRSAQRGTACGV